MVVVHGAFQIPWNREILHNSSLKELGEEAAISLVELLKRADAHAVPRLRARGLVAVQLHGAHRRTVSTRCLSTLWAEGLKTLGLI